MFYCHLTNGILMILQLEKRFEPTEASGDDPSPTGNKNIKSSDIQAVFSHLEKDGGGRRVFHSFKPISSGLDGEDGCGCVGFRCG